MNENELRERLAQICQEHHIDRFQPEDIWEMLADGENVDWLLGMLTENKPEALEPLKVTLLEISEFAKPAIPEAETVPSEALVVEAIESGAADEQMEELLNSPHGRIMGDFLLFCQEKGIDISNLQDNQKALKPYLNQWMDEPRVSFEGKTPRAMVEENPEMIYPEKVETFRREQDKVGRNDPCPCGSGKKYKKCCGREE